MLGELAGRRSVAVGLARRVGTDEDVLPLDGVVDLELLGMLLVVLQHLFAADLVEERHDAAAQVFRRHELPRPLAADRLQ